MNVGRAIKLCRNQRSMTLKDLSDKAGFSQSYLSLLETNKRDPSLSTIENVALALNIPFSLLIFLASDKDDLAGLSPDLASKMAFTALTFINAESEQQSLL